MAITDQSIVNVYNYSDSPVSLATTIKPDGYWFEPAINEESPSIIPMSFLELRVANGQSEIFRDGGLKFDKEQEKEIYEKLLIRNWEEILTLKEIEDTILNPSKKKLEKIVKITNLSAFDKIRGALVRLQNTAQYDISQRVVDTINYRYQELYTNKRRTEIVIKKTKQEELEDVKNKTIKSEIEKIKKDLEKSIRAEIKAELLKETEVKKETEIKKETETKKKSTKKDEKSTKKE